MADISIRKHIAWLPDAASEPTSTIVLTSPGRRFVDLRILLDPKPSSDGTLSLSSLDWAIAGTSTSTPLPSPDATTRFGTPSQCTWAHWISSRTPDTTSLIDTGTNHPLPDGTTLETGTMTNPDTGLPTPYEELWASEEILPVPAFTPSGPALVRVCLVLQMEGEDEGGRQRRGMLVRLGQYCQVVVRTGEGEGDVTIERVQWKGEGEGWVRTVRVGGAEVPTDWATHLGHEAVEGDVVRVRGEEWRVVEREEV